MSCGATIFRPAMTTPMAFPGSFSSSLQKFSYAFAGIGLLELISNVLRTDYPLFHYLCKPLIMISLSVFFFYQMLHQHERTYYLMQAAILFSLMGDIFLMFEGDLFFQLGLGSFLLAQIFYILVFAAAPKGSPGPVLWRKPWLILPFGAYAFGLISLMYEQLGPLLIPVLVYATALSCMVLAALNRWRRVRQDSFAYVFLGALLFLISDSMIAVNRFASDILPIPMVSVWIMLTYIVAQYLIVAGVLLQLKSESPQG